LHLWSDRPCALLHLSRCRYRWSQANPRLVLVLQKILERIAAASLYLCKPLLYTLLCCPRYCLFTLLLALLRLAQKILKRITTGRLNLSKPRLCFLCRCWLTRFWRR